MTNRERFFLKRDEYDTMVQIYTHRVYWCPIQIVGAEKPECLVQTTESGYRYSDCRECIAKWLNEEAK